MGLLRLNAYDSEQSDLERVLSAYDMLVNAATHIAGLLLDQVFVQKCIFQQVDVTNIVCSTFFSHHESVGVTIWVKSLWM